MWKIALSEIVGTFIFISVILQVTSSNAKDLTVLSAFIIGLALTVAIYFGGKASLGAYNPCLVLALFARGDLNIPTSILYIIAEIIGCLLAFAWWRYVALGSTLKL